MKMLYGTSARNVTDILDDIVKTPLTNHICVASSRPDVFDSVWENVRSGVRETISPLKWGFI